MVSGSTSELRNWHHGEVQGDRVNMTVVLPDLNRRQRDGLIAATLHDDPVSARTLVNGAEQLDPARGIDLCWPQTINERSLANRSLRTVSDVLPVPASRARTVMPGSMFSVHAPGSVHATSKRDITIVAGTKARMARFSCVLSNDLRIGCMRLLGGWSNYSATSRTRCIPRVAWYRPVLSSSKHTNR